MNSLKFRTNFSLRLRLGKRSKLLNSRTKRLEDPNPILIVDLSYIKTLLLSRKKSKVAKNISDSERFYSWLFNIFKLLNPSGILFIGEKEIEDIVLPSVPIYGNVKDIVFSLLSQKHLTSAITILSNNLELWALASPTAKLSFLAIDSNNRLIYYNNKTGLDVLSKFIGTYKIVNKLGLDSLKFMSLQYLYILLFYIQFTNRRKNENFYFDGTFFKDSNTTKPFLKSKGSGLDFITNAHKFLSYAFLTKNEFLDYFLIGQLGHYQLQLQRLQKLLSIDTEILNYMKIMYDRNYKPQTLEIQLPSLTPTMPNTFAYYNMIWKSENFCRNISEHRQLAHLLKKLPNPKLIPTLPKVFQPKISIPEEPVTFADTRHDIEDYVNNLLIGS